MSFSLTLRPPRNVWRFRRVTRMPWRRRLVRTTVSDAALVSPRTWRLLRSTPSQMKVNSLTRMSRRGAVAVVVAMAVLCARRRRSFVGDGLDFLERGQACLHLEQARLAQVADAFLLR